ncbi:pyridoxamine 5'-phosphate oxidase family protein [Halorarum salinum]|uniref:Pyridoxamine 5'-phosphate oxidase family protein n=1 Tax=Halorarum salinum TaxID=2743089 RepID=A0A7D5LB27_9EURY|nr:pyridoxamine 5'-phosphate oxidase family protein [Halobaculum salinum]QLG62472.1 pyridoxamine 5'-phosphate oxidase family protein [Halobaculum salinum]
MVVPDRVTDRIADAPLSAHVATSVEDRPHVAPVWYAYEDGSLWITTGGKKLRNVRRNPRVAVSIESADRAGNVDWNATLLATARVVDDAEREEEVLDAIDRKYRGDTDDRDDAGDGDAEADGGEESAGALVELRIASATLAEY